MTTSSIVVTKTRSLYTPTLRPLRLTLIVRLTFPAAPEHIPTVTSLMLETVLEKSRSELLDDRPLRGRRDGEFERERER